MYLKEMKMQVKYALNIALVCASALSYAGNRYNAKPAQEVGPFGLEAQATDELKARLSMALTQPMASQSV